MGAEGPDERFKEVFFGLAGLPSIAGRCDSSPKTWFNGMVASATCLVGSAVEQEPETSDGKDATVDVLGFVDACSSGFLAVSAPDGLDIGTNPLCWLGVDEEELEELELRSLCGVCGIVRAFIGLEPCGVSGLPGFTSRVGAMGTGTTGCGVGSR